MRDRRLVVVAAVALAVLATVAVFLYVNNVRQEARTGGELVPVVVARQDIPAGSDLGALAQQGVFQEIEVPTSAYVQGAVQSLGQLSGKRNNQPILAGEQIPPERLEGGEQPEGGVLGIPKGYQAVAFALERDRLVAGAIQRGDRVQIYYVVDRHAGSSTTLDNDALVLAVANPDPTDDDPEKDMAVTVALRGRDVQRTVLAEEEGDLYLALLPPGESGIALKPVPVEVLLR